MLKEETEDIIITTYEKEYYADFVEAGYYLHFQNHLKPDIRRRFKEFIYRTFFLNEKEKTLVAYSQKDGKAVGSITARKITNNLWGLWKIFVSPAHRGRRIASLLLKETLHHLEGKKVEKIISYVAKTNISSIKHSRRSGWKPLRNRVFKCQRIGTFVEPDSKKIAVRKLRHDEKEQLFDVFERCVGKEWCSYLEINKDNYLNRIYGPAFCEEYDPFSRAVMKKAIVVAESRGEMRGYAISRAVCLFNNDYVTHLFVPISRDFDTICKSLLLKTFRPQNYKGKNKFSFVYIGDDTSREHFENLGFEIQEFLVQALRL